VVELILLAELVLHTVSYQELRYETVVAQSYAHTCGPAAVATLLTYYYGVPMSEDEALNLAEQFMPNTNQDSGHPMTALTLKRIMETKGFAIRGYRVTLDALRDYFSRGGLPLIVHTTVPQKHFSVVVGAFQDQIVLADPSWGRQTMPLELFQEELGFSGIVLVPIPSSGMERSARTLQQTALSEPQSRLSWLIDLQEDLP
jgi:uncharacterized protein